MQKRINRTDDTKVENLLSGAIGKLKTLVDTDVVIGEKIEAGDATIIPLTKVSVGIVAGGGEYGSATSSVVEDFPFAGGTGAGYSATPVGLLVIFNNGKDVKLVNVNPNDPLSKIIDSLPGLVDKINDKIMDNQKAIK